MKDLGTLEDTVQGLRAREFPHLPEALVTTILQIEAENVEDRAHARDLVATAVTEALQAGDAE